MKKLLIDPLFIFVVVWCLVFVLFSFHWSAILLTMDSSFRRWSLVSLAAAVIGYTVARFLVRALLSRRRHVVAYDTSDLKRSMRWIAITIAVIAPIEIVVSGGLPILWRLQGNPKLYTDYGIPTVHGFFNALLLFAGTVAFWFTTSRRATTAMKLLFLSCLIFPVFAVTRQVLVSLVVQCGIVFIGARVRSRELVIPWLLAAAVITMAAFAAVGDFRTSNEGFYAQAEIVPGAAWMSPSLAWHYIYLTTPVNNFLYLTQTEAERTNGAQTLATITPTVVRTAWFGQKAGLPPKLVKETFNVTSYATPLYLDFGWPGVVAFTFLMLFLGGYAYERFVRSNDLASLLLLAVLDQILLFTFFVNFLITWGVLFQLFLVILLRRRLQAVDATVKPKTSHALRRLLRTFSSPMVVRPIPR